MFKLVENATYWWPVPVRVPLADDPGKFEESTLDIQYRYLDTDEHDALVAEADEKKLKDPEMALRIVAGFRDVSDAKGVEIPFSEAALERLVKIHGVAFSIVREYWGSRKEAQKKN